MISSRFTTPTAGARVRTLQLFRPTLDLLAEVLRRRQIRRSYGRMSGEMLRDIGLTRWDIEVALSLPLEKSAADAIANAAAGEAARW